MPRRYSMNSPLLDELAASVDHLHAFAKGGAHDISNFATICPRCNARKGAFSVEQHRLRNPPWLVKGKHGEPTAWDGLAVFVVLARRTARPLTAAERGWLTALQLQWDQQAD